MTFNNMESTEYKRIKRFAISSISAFSKFSGRKVDLKEIKEHLSNPEALTAVIGLFEKYGIEISNFTHSYGKDS